MSEDRIRYIYCITNLVNGKNYFGQRTMQPQYKNPLADLYWGSGVYLKSAQKKYGLENFKKEIIISGKFSKEQINRFEKCIIACQRLVGKAEYNIADGGQGGKVFWGTERCTKEYLENQSKKAKLARLLYPESFQKARETAKETIKKKKENGWHGWSHYKGLSEEQKEAISKAMKGKNLGSKNPSFGKHWWTNGETTIKCEVCPKGFWAGRNGSLPKDVKRNIHKKEVESKKEKRILSQIIYECKETGEKGNRQFWKERINTNNLSRVVNTNWTINGLHFVTVC